MRLRRICSTSEAFQQRAADLCKFLEGREYRKSFVEQHIGKARAKTREEALTTKPRNTNEQIPLVVTYHPGLPNIGGILRELQPILHCSERRRNAITETPMMAFRRPKNLGDYLVHVKLKPSQKDKMQKRTVQSQVAQAHHERSAYINLFHFAYIMTSPKCKGLYEKCNKFALISINAK